MVPWTLKDILFINHFPETHNMLSYKRTRDAYRNTNEYRERKTETSPDGHTITTEYMQRETEEEYHETEQELQLSAEFLQLQKIPALRQLEEEKMRARQDLATNSASLRYLFQWIETDIERSKVPLPLVSPAEMQKRGWAVVDGPELVWIPLYWRATRPGAVVELPDLLWISEMEMRGAEVWACCDFQWADNGRRLTKAWVPELLLRSYPPYQDMVNAATRQTIRQVYDQMEYATHKRIGLLQPSLALPAPALAAPPEPEPAPPKTQQQQPLPPDFTALEKMFDFPESLEPEIQKLREELKNVLVPQVQQHLNGLSLTEQLFFLGDPTFVVSRYYVAAMDGDVMIALPRIQVANFIQGTKIRCQVEGLEDPVWLPACLILAACRLHCRCVASCSCRWRALEVAYNALTKFICGSS